MPRPPIQHHRFFIEIERDTQEFLDSVINKLILTRIAGKGVEAVGEAVKGAVSHPIGFLAVSAAITAYLVGKYGGGAKEEEDLTELLQRAYPEIPPEFFTAWETTWKITRALFPFLPGFPDVGIPSVTPPTEKEKLCAQLAKERANIQVNMIEEPGQADFWQNALNDVNAKIKEAGCGF